MPLILRKITTHPHVNNAHQVIYEGLAIGSIGLQLLADNAEEWRWGIYYTPTRTEGYCIESLREGNDQWFRSFKIGRIASNA